MYTVAMWQLLPILDLACRSVEDKDAKERGWKGGGVRAALSAVLHPDGALQLAFLLEASR